MQRCAGGDDQLYTPDTPKGRSGSLEAVQRLLEGVQDRALACLRNLFDVLDGPADVGLDSWQPLWTSLCALIPLAASGSRVSGPAQLASVTETLWALARRVDERLVGNQPGERMPMVRLERAGARGSDLDG